MRSSIRIQLPCNAETTHLMHWQAPDAASVADHWIYSESCQPQPWCEGIRYCR